MLAGEDIANDILFVRLTCRCNGECDLFAFDYFNFSADGAKGQSLFLSLDSSITLVLPLFAGSK